MSKKTDDWMKTRWRPMMGWVYMVTCLFDFVIAPIFWAIQQAVINGKVDGQWQPLTLEGAGLYHLAMGAVLGVAAWSRGQEKMSIYREGVNNIVSAESSSSTEGQEPR